MSLQDLRYSIPNIDYTSSYISFTSSQVIECSKYSTLGIIYSYFLAFTFKPLCYNLTNTSSILFKYLSNDSFYITNKSSIYTNTFSMSSTSYDICY